MNTARALTVLVAAGIIGGGIGLAAHAATKDETSPNPTRPSASQPTTKSPSSAPPSSPSPGTSTTTSTTSSGLKPLSVNNVFTAADLRAANFEVARGRYLRDDANNFQYATTPCMRSSLGHLTGSNSYAAEAYGDQDAFVDEAISEMINETQARTAAKTLVKWHTGTCSGGARFTARGSRAFDGGTLWTFTSNQGDTVGVIRFDSRLAVVTVSHEPSAATADKVMAAAIKRLAVPAT